MKKTFLTMTALSALVLISPPLQDKASANKPAIRIAKPTIKLNVDTRRLSKQATTTRPGREAVEAGPQPEPPTHPKKIRTSDREKQASAPLPRPRPYNEFDEGRHGLDAEEALPPVLGAPPALQELFDVTGGNINDIKDVASLLENGLDGRNALPDHLGDGGGDFPGEIGGDRRFGGNRVGTWDPFGGRGSALGPAGSDDGFGVDMMAGIPRSPASRAPRSGLAGRDIGGGWSGERHDSGNGSFKIIYRHENGGQMAVEYAADGSIKIESSGANGSSTVQLSPADGNGDYTYSETGSKGRVVDAVLHIDNDDDPNNAGSWPPTEHDQNGDGRPDGSDIDSGNGGGPAGQPNPEGDSAASGICAGWNPLNGCGRPGLKVWDMTSQPDPSDEGTSTVGSAGASIGPEAVTNGGDGSFGAEGGSGSGGVTLDPCITAGGGCGNGPDGPDGPDNPAGAVAAAAAARN